MLIILLNHIPAEETSTGLLFTSDDPSILGGETGSTGIRMLKLHTEVLPARKTGGYKPNADDYAYAVAA
jgi:hypothetical protein